jgi:hypothetical protein
MDTLYGGFLSTYTYDFKPTGDQNKFIVTQARHTWSTSKAAMRYPRIAYYKTCATNGYKFLHDVMWDKTYGGFYTMVDRKGNVIDSTKNAYGNAFGIYAVAAYCQLTNDPDASYFAQQAFMWLEKHSHDPVHKGYYQHMQRDGTPIQRTAGTPATAETGYKDQNSSIHLLEAFTELYPVWQSAIVRERLYEMLLLIRDTMIGNANTDGTAWMYAVSGLYPLWTHYDYPVQQGPGYHRFIFWAHADDADTDPRVAEAVKALNIRYVLTSTPVVRKFAMPDGLVSLDKSRSWEKIYDNGESRIYEWRGSS